MSGYRRNRPSALALTLAAVAALMALAGPAAATGDRHGDDDPAGTIASYDGDSGKLTIDLAAGGSISGVVTGRTWIDDGERGCGEDRKARHGRKALHGDWCDERGRRGDGRHHDWHPGPGGEESDLVAGAVVEDAILVLKDGRAWFAKVDLD